jgi:hypothetical protein
VAGQRIYVVPAVIVDAAMASGRIGPAGRDHWLTRIAAGGTAGGTAVMSLLRLTPVADRATAARWAREVRAGGQPRRTQDPQETLYASVYPDTAEPGGEPVHPGGAPAIPESEAGHAAFYGWHSHPHSDGQAGEHDHLHEHAGDSSHAAGGTGTTSHVHDASIQLNDPVQAGIAARAHATGARALSDEELMRRLFGGS